jgi:hypothetical protein
MARFIQFDMPIPRDGMDNFTNPLELPATLSPNMENTRVIARYVTQRPGLGPFGNDIFSTDLNGDEFPISIFTADRRGVRETICFTRIQAFRFKGDAAAANEGVWEHITPIVAIGGGVTFDFQNASATVDTSIDPTGQVVVGDFIKPDSEADRTTWGEITAITPGDPSVTLRVAYTGATTGPGAAASKQVQFTGTDDEPWSLETFEDEVFASQGVEKVHKYTGTGQFTEVADSVPCKHLAVFNRRLFLAHTFEGGNFLTNKIRWSAIDDPDDYSVSPTSGDENLTVIDEPITYLLPGRSQLVVYRETAIQTATNTGVVEAPFAFSFPVTGIGALGRTPVDVGGFHIFLSRDNIYVFDGASAPQPIGERIRDENITFNFNRKEQAFAIYDTNTREYMLFVPLGENLFPNAALVFYVPERRWTKWNFPEPTTAIKDGVITAAAIHTSQDSEIWDNPPIAAVPLDSDPLLSWDNDAGAWDDLASTGAPGIVVSTTSASVDKFDQQFVSDNGTDILPMFETKDVDFTEQEGIDRAHYKTVGRVRLRYEDVGTPFTVAMNISTDGGLTFQGGAVKTIGGGAGVREEFFDIWITGTAFRARFQKTAGTGEFRPVEVSFLWIPRAPQRIAL